jgi:hypothetical protein
LAKSSCPLLEQHKKSEKKKKKHLSPFPKICEEKKEKKKKILFDNIAIFNN